VLSWIRLKKTFGGLRFYYHGGDDVVDGMVRMAEAWADRTCETCGEKGERRTVVGSALYAINTKLNIKNVIRG